MSSFKISEFYPFVFLHNKNDRFCMHYNGKKDIKKVELRVLKCLGLEGNKGIKFLDKNNNIYYAYSDDTLSIKDDTIFSSSVEMVQVPDDLYKTEETYPVFGLDLKAEYGQFVRCVVSNLFQNSKEYMEELDKLMAENNLVVVKRQMKYLNGEGVMDVENKPFMVIDKVEIPDSLKW